MADAIENAIKRIKKIQNSVEQIAIEEFKKEDALMSDLNRSQLLSGTDALGNPMPNYVSTSRKRGRTNLFDEGDYHQGIKPLFDDVGINMISTDRKFAFLDPKYNTALGINENSQQILIEKTKPKIIDRLKKI